MKAISIRSHFLNIVLPVVGTIWLVMTCLFTWNDYQVNLDSRLMSEELIAETFITGIRQPLIQGSFVEAKIRAESLLKSKQVKCIGITVGTDIIQPCEPSAITGNFIHGVRKPIKFDENLAEEFGAVSLYFDNSDLIVRCLGRLAWSAFGIAFLAILLFIALNKGMNPVRTEIEAILAQAKEDPTSSVARRFQIAEFGAVSLELRENMRVASQVVQATASLAVAKQVAHDIRSPLASLKMLIEDIKTKIPETYATALGSNVKRISEIASDLIERNEEKVRKHFEIVCANQICEEIISEKRNIHAKAKDLEISASSFAKNSLISINPSDFRRVLSNLLDNSIEACSVGGNVSIQLKNDERNLEIIIADTGKGISDEVVGRLFKPGATYGKPNGKGLGLAHAKATIEAAGGKIGIFSQMGVGTELRIVLAFAMEKAKSESTSTELIGDLVEMNV